MCSKAFFNFIGLQGNKNTSIFLNFCMIPLSHSFSEHIKSSSSNMCSEHTLKKDHFAGCFRPVVQPFLTKSNYKHQWVSKNFKAIFRWFWVETNTYSSRFARVLNSIHVQKDFYTGRFRNPICSSGFLLKSRLIFSHGSHFFVYESLFEVNYFLLSTKNSRKEKATQLRHNLIHSEYSFECTIIFKEEIK